MKQASASPSLYKGRFAPTPSGPLHKGSLINATASYLDALAHNGKWLLRIEDLDRKRSKKAHADTIQYQLEAFGFQWHGQPLYQSRRLAVYEEFIQRLRKQGLAYYCACSRKQIQQNALKGAEGYIYTGRCRNGTNIEADQLATRLRTENRRIEFIDRIQGHQHQDVETEVGDFVIKRADGEYAYQLAVVVDDAYQDISHVVRGVDLLFSTARQIYLQQLLGYKPVHYAHHALLFDETGHKIAKRLHANPLDTKNPVQSLNMTLEFLGQQAIDTDSLDEFWQAAALNWSLK